MRRLNKIDEKRSDKYVDWYLYNLNIATLNIIFKTPTGT